MNKAYFTVKAEIRVCKNVNTNDIDVIMDDISENDIMCGDIKDFEVISDIELEDENGDDVRCTCHCPEADRF